MRFLDKLFVLVWSLWCWWWFVVALTIMFPLLVVVVVIGNEKLIYRAHFIPPAVCRLLLFMWGVRVEVKNVEMIDAHGQYVYISNHTSYLDALVAAASIPNFLKFLGKAEILHWPVLGFLLKKFYVPVWRNDKDHRAWSMEQMNEKVKTGASFFICPEGTCNTTPELLTHFHNGAYRLAIPHKLPLVPLTFIGCGKLMPRSGLFIRPGKVAVYWHTAISTTSMTLDDVEVLKQQSITVLMKDLLVHFPEGKYEV